MCYVGEFLVWTVELDHKRRITMLRWCLGCPLKICSRVANIYIQNYSNTTFDILPLI
jgi:hypothetical protein